ncbi:MAG TPA: type I-A CRISPR-associated protein Cas4/Csa1 [Candidatus Hydrothermia bacterium]|nr:type I-A CRISPR-associated protein Cas4/Csa1 [Candidatus Hydrothermia bacterium]HPO79576.1 type I-A CRISPR-associated protein Cas4/Csa1 [Candidatus Hydrothermia bacterium]
MYFLSPEEHKYVTRKLLMDARRDEVHPDLRGWNWSQPPLATDSKVKLGVSDIASLYCPTGRDLYLKKIANVGFRANEAMVEGLLLHRVVSEVFTRSKVIIYGNKSITSWDYAKMLGQIDLMKEAKGWGFNTGEKVEKTTSLPLLTEAMLQKGQLIWDFEKTRIGYRIDDIRSRYPYCESDAFVFLVLPVVVEQRLNGAFLGLSQNLAVDGYIFSEGMVVDLKFDPEIQDFHKLTTTGYAMVMESLYEFPVDLGCIVYVRFKDGQIRINREFHHISDELRQWFIEERDRKMRFLEDEVDPGKPEECYLICPYKEICIGQE